MRASTNYYIILTIFTIFYFLSLNGRSLVQYFFAPGAQLNSSLPIKFYNNAYLDFRYTPPRLRLFSLNACVAKNDYLLVDLFYEGVPKPTRMRVYGEPLEGNCPSLYAPATPCFYNPYTFFGDVMETGEIEYIIIHLGSRQIKLPITKIQKQTEKGLTLCMQAIYYYTQWQYLILFIESWRAHGATRFIVFFHSSTKETRMVLDYFEKLGIIELRPWPSFGTLPDEISLKHPKPDDSSHIFAHFLANNVCILDIKTEIGGMVDFDEVMVPTTGRVIDYAYRMMKDTNIGELSFENHYVAMKPNIYSSDFSGVSNLVFYERDGPRKYLSNASVIDIAQIHWTRTFIDKTKKVKNADGALLHLRYNVKEYDDKRLMKPYRFFPGNESVHIQNMQKTVNETFNGKPPIVPLHLMDVLNQCVNGIIKKGGTCRSTGGFCKPAMDKVYDWVYDESEDIFV